MLLPASFSLPSSLLLSPFSVPDPPLLCKSRPAHCDSTATMWTSIKPARLDPNFPKVANDEVKISDGQKTSRARFGVIKFRFDNIPIDHEHPNAWDATVSLHATLVYSSSNLNGHSVSPSPASWKEIIKSRQNKSLLLYLCGGPGDANPHQKVPNISQAALERGYQVLFVDYRGTGKSIAAHQERLARIQKGRRAHYLSMFRQDNIVRDLEAIRLCLGKELSRGQALAVDIKFSLLTQSFGGWIALTYLSFLPSSLTTVHMSAGLAPIGSTPEQVYKKLYQRVVSRNKEFYATVGKDDIRSVRRIVRHLANQKLPYIHRIKLDGEGKLYEWQLTAHTFMSLGRAFGGHEPDFQGIHNLVVKMDEEIKSQGTLSKSIDMYAKLQAFRLHERPLYGVMHEAIYCYAPGVVSAWAARRVGIELSQGEYPQFSWISNARGTVEDSNMPLYFSGEMIYPKLLEAGGKAFGEMGEAADMLAHKTDWPALYNLPQLQKNQVPVRAIAYKDDMYVDYDLSMKTAKTVRGCEVVADKEGWDHGSIKDPKTTESVIRRLLGPV